MPASYPSSAKTFSTKATNDIIEASHINDLQDEIAAIESGLLTALGHDLKFTDATYDIGKSGATRPRDGFFSRNLTVGGTLTPSGGFVVAATPFTPTWTGTGSNPVIGNGTLAGSYFQIGKLVIFEIEVLMGSTTTFGSGTYEFALPVPAANVRGAMACGMLDSGTSFYTATAILHSTTVLRVNITSGAQVGATAPFTFAPNDYIKISGSYIAA